MKPTFTLILPKLLSVGQTPLAIPGTTQLAWQALPGSTSAPSPQGKGLFCTTCETARNHQSFNNVLLVKIGWGRFGIPFIILYLLLKG